MINQLARPTDNFLPADRRNGWVRLDRAWARTLGVTRDQGRYRIRHRELIRRLATADGLFSVPGNWTIDPAHTNVGFVAPHLVVSEVTGGFREVRGTVSVGPDPGDSWVDVTVDTASIDTGLPVRDAHLRAAFLDSANHPQMRFRSTGLEICGPRTCRVSGHLTLRGVTRPLTMDLRYLGTATDQAGNPRVSFEATATIDREDYGLVWNRVLEAGGLLVGRHIQLQIEAQAGPPSEEPAA